MRKIVPVVAFLVLLVLGAFAFMRFTDSSSLPRVESENIQVSEDNDHVIINYRVTFTNLPPARQYWSMATCFVGTQYADWKWLGGSEGLSDNIISGKYTIKKSDLKEKDIMVVYEISTDDRKPLFRSFMTKNLEKSLTKP